MSLFYPIPDMSHRCVLLSRHSTTYCWADERARERRTWKEKTIRWPRGRNFQLQLQVCFPSRHHFPPQAHPASFRYGTVCLFICYPDPLLETGGLKCPTDPRIFSLPLRPRPLPPPPTALLNSWQMWLTVGPWFSGRRAVSSCARRR